MTSTQHVLQVPELFELILMEVPVRTLLTSAQLVCKSWNQRITSSRRIQQALFLESCPPDTPPRINPLLAAEFSIFFDGKQHRRSDFSELAFAYQAEESRKGLPFPPAPPTPGSSKSIDSSVAQAAQDPPVKAAVPDNQGHLALREKFLHPSASWRRMLPRQPAVMEVGLWRYEKVQGNRTVRRFRVLRIRKNGRDSSMKTSDLKNQAQTGNARRDSRVVNKDHGRLGWTMGAIYDEGVHSVSLGTLSFRVFWDIQSIIRREAEEDQRRSDSDEPPMYDSNGNRSGGGRGRDPGTNVRIAQAQVYRGNTSPNRTSWKTQRLGKALGDRNVVFQTIHQRGCGMAFQSAPRWPGMEKEQREFETYYSFPAGKLDRLE